ncbi:hypothetical protein FKW77_001550 [Venturia effusa]|uniref:Uncharacterized protein n=1 Tax=Venturia effusa TaxID=50376 RepID=A0A517LQN8_9PEZI|nr:hypothetical protein FKW77_001550 [Venturia effusa]
MYGRLPMLIDPLEDIQCNFVDRTTIVHCASRYGLANLALRGLAIHWESMNINTQDSHGRTPLSISVIWAQEIVTKCLAGVRGIDFNSPDSEGCTALSHAAQAESAPDGIFHDEAFPDETLITRLTYIAITKLLLSKEGIDLNRQDKAGRSPLSYAAERPFREIVELLLQHTSIQPDIQDSDGRTPLSFAIPATPDEDPAFEISEIVKVCQERLAIAKLFLGTGKVDPLKKDADGRSPLKRAEEYLHLLKQLDKDGRPLVGNVRDYVWMGDVQELVDLLKSYVKT